MGFFVEQLWNPVDESHLSRKDRIPGRYRAYVPDELDTFLPRLSASTQQAAEDALVVLARIDERIGTRGYLNHLLIRSEGISSSWIEGNRITPKRLAIAELLERGSRVALEVVANVRATEKSIAQLADRDRKITVADVENLQRAIVPEHHTGLRKEQNWVGGTGWSPLRAEFVPPPEGEVRRLVANLCDFVTATDGNPIVRAALAHAQFETIHPFVDGNGRTGRALIHTVLRRSDALRNTLIPISTVFAGHTDSYIAGLTGYRASPPRLDDWVTSFAQATELAAANALHFVERATSLGEELREKLTNYRSNRGASPAKPRKDAVVIRILADLASTPVVTVETVASYYDVSPAASHRALTELSEAGILGRVKDHRGRLVCWTADQYLALVQMTERSNRVGGKSTSHHRPRHASPRVNEL